MVNLKPKDQIRQWHKQKDDASKREQPKHVLKVGLKPVLLHMLVLMGKFAGKLGLLAKPAKENQ